MLRNRFVLFLATASLLLLGMVVLQPSLSGAISRAEGAIDFYQRHPDWTWAINDQNAIVPVAGGSVYLDYAQRHPELTIAFIPVTGGSVYLDYAQRHPELSVPVVASVDTTDDYFRHPELSGSTTKSIDLTDYFFRHPELRSK